MVHARNQAMHQRDDDADPFHPWNRQRPMSAAMLQECREPMSTLNEVALALGGIEPQWVHPPPGWFVDLPHRVPVLTSSRIGLGKYAMLLEIYM